MRTNAAILGPKYQPFELETEASNQRAVRLAAGSDYLEFTVETAVNALVIRYSVPDAPQGRGQNSSLQILVRGQPVRTVALTSRYSHLYGRYPFTNNPADGRHRNFYDEVRVKDLTLAPGDFVRLRKPAASAPDVIVDFVDTENVPPPLTAPPDSLSIVSFGAVGNGQADATAALRAAIAAGQQQRKTVWIPPGDYKITGDILVPSDVTVQGAGLWHTNFVGDDKLYAHADRRVRFKLNGSHIRLADFAITGCLDYRNDNEPNDGVVGAGCTDAEIARVWVEHTKTGAWIYNGVRLRIEGCRFRDLLADGVNLCVGCSHDVIENCTARGAGDDCFAIWPVPTDQGFAQGEKPGHNVIRRCTGQLPFLANGGALYGGVENRIEDCLFSDITAGCGILISTTFPTADESRGIDNNFSGETRIDHCQLLRCGGYDHDWAWRGALQICLDRQNISGLVIANVEIRDSFSDGLTVVGPGSAKGRGTLRDSRVENVTIANWGLEGASHHALLVRADARGGLTIPGKMNPDRRNDSGAFALVEAEH